MLGLYKVSRKESATASSPRTVSDSAFEISSSGRALSVKKRLCSVSWPAVKMVFEILFCARFFETVPCVNMGACLRDYLAIDRLTTPPHFRIVTHVRSSSNSQNQNILRALPAAYALLRHLC